MERLYDQLKEYSAQDYYGFHMPGHKRNQGFMGIDLPYEIDITEIDGFDDLHHADGILKEAQKRAARVFGADETHFLVNGSTVGILSAVLGCTKRGNKILIARHCHKSVYHAVYLNGLVPRYVYPEFDGSVHMNGEIRKEDVERALKEEPDICAVVVVSPNYDGVVSDVKAIADICHSRGIPLIVDEAHGAHFGFHPAFPGRANSLGADVVINSLHKTLPSLTQTALLHINGSLVNREKIRKHLDMLQSSSPSYVFMASLDACVDFLDGDPCREAFDRYVRNLKNLRSRLGELTHLRLLEMEHYDPSKLVISTAKTDLTSYELYEKLLRDYHLQMEMVGGTYVLGMTSVADTEEGMNRLAEALEEVDTFLNGGLEKQQEAAEEASGLRGELPRQVQVLTPYEAALKEEKSEVEAISWRESEGRIALEYAYLYPPGSPVIVPGERISREAVELLTYYDEQKLRIEGIRTEGIIKVWRNE